MIISPRKKFVFIHIPKNGGTSVTNFFDASAQWDDIIVGGTAIGELFNASKWRSRFGLAKHSSFPEVRQIIGDEWLADKRVFAVVRHPVSRFLSTCNFLVTSVANGVPWLNPFLEKYHLAADVPLSHFSTDIFLSEANVSKPWDEITRLFARQSFFLGPGDRVEPKKLEELTGHDLALLMSVKDAPLPRRNQSGKQFTEMDLQPETIQRLIEVYREDFERLGYEPVVRAED
jgi:hypothetical protein